ncbi:MAG: DUF47 domain-containing protein [Christensenellales bacterium]
MKQKNNYNYFDSFIQCATYSCAAAQYLQDTLTSFNPETFATRMKEMHTIENDADQEKHEMIKYLSREFITSIEREDIVDLAQELDNVTDSIDDVVRRMYMFNIMQIRPEAVEFSKLIVQCCEAMKTAVKEFKNFRKSKTINDYIVETNRLESVGDDLHASSIRSLFLQSQSNLNTFVWVNIFDGLEHCLDCCENVVDIIESVIMKNS